MNSTKKMALITIASLMVGFGMAHAGPGHKHGKMCWDEKTTDKKVEKKLKRISKNIDLDESQKSQVEKILRSHMEKKRIEAQKMHEKHMELKAEFNQEIKGVLTEDQNKKYEELNKKRADKNKKKCKKHHKKGK